MIFCVQFPFISTDFGDNWIRSLDCIFQSEKHFENSEHCSFLQEYVDINRQLGYLHIHNKSTVEKSLCD